MLIRRVSKAMIERKLSKKLDSLGRGDPNLAIQVPTLESSSGTGAFSPKNQNDLVTTVKQINKMRIIS
jgi:hypothetical protein